MYFLWALLGKSKMFAFAVINVKELMMSIMNAPLSGLLAISNIKSVETGDLHPLVGLKTSLSNLGPQSFVPGVSASTAIPGAFSMQQLLTGSWATSVLNQPSWERCPQGCSYAFPKGNVCPECGGGGYHLGAAYPPHQQPVVVNLKDNGKFMVTDALEVFESSTIMAMELMKEHVEDFRCIKTSTETVTEEIVRKLIVCSMLGSQKVLTEIFPDTDVHETASSVVSDGSFEAIDAKEQTKGRRAWKQGK